jgi:hypothetical protein
MSAVGTLSFLATEAFPPRMILGWTIRFLLAVADTDSPGRILVLRKQEELMIARETRRVDASAKRS